MYIFSAVLEIKDAYICVIDSVVFWDQVAAPWVIPANVGRFAINETCSPQFMTDTIQYITTLYDQSPNMMSLLNGIVQNEQEIRIAESIEVGGFSETGSEPGSPIYRDRFVAFNYGNMALEDFKRSSYLSSGPISNFDEGDNYTNEEEIDISRVGTDDPQVDGVDVLDTSTRTDSSRDLMFGRVGDDVLSSGEGNDHLYGGSDADILNTGAGDDRVFGESGSDELTGGAGSDYLVGGSDGDTEEDDDILSGDGLDRFVGGAGADTTTITGEAAGEPEIDAGLGYDTTNIQTGYGRVYYEYNVGDGIDHVQSPTPWSADHILEVSGDVDWAVFDLYLNVESAILVQGNPDSGSWRVLANARIVFGEDQELLIDKVMFDASAGPTTFNPSSVSYLVTDGLVLGFNGPELIQGSTPQFDGDVFWV